MMNTYVILRRSGWKSPAELEEAAGRSKQVGDEQMSDDIRWIRSYVLEEGGSTVGTVCVYQATSEDAIRKHGELAELPVDEVIPIADTVIMRPDPETGRGVGHTRRLNSGAARLRSAPPHITLPRVAEACARSTPRAASPW